MKKVLLLSLSMFVIGLLSLAFSGADGAELFGTSLAAIPAICVPFVKDNKFQEKTQEELEAMDEQEMAAYILAKNEWNNHQLAEKIAALGAEHKEVIDFKEQIIEDSQKLTATVLKQGAAIQRLMSTLRGPEATIDEKAQINKFIEENAQKIKDIKAAGHGMIEMTVKAPASMTTGSATNPDGIPELVGTQIAPATDVNLRGVVVDALVTMIQTSVAAYAYTETVPKDGDYTFVAEGGTKPQMDFSIETRYAEPHKIAAHIVLTDEAVEDIRGMQSIANNYLRAKHALKRQNGILFGTGVAPEPTGATVYGRTFVAGAMATAVPTPNFMDVVNACVTDIFTTHNYTDEMPYMANICMINPVDFYLELVSAKDANGLPLYPQAGLFNRVTLGGVTIIPFEDIPAGKIFVADMSKYNVTDYIPYTVRIGWINDQLITNQFTMVGESRMHAFVKNLDEQAFIYDDIATVRTAITAP